MLSKVTSVFQKEGAGFAAGFFLLTGLVWLRLPVGICSRPMGQPLRPAGVHSWDVRFEIQERLAQAEAPPRALAQRLLLVEAAVNLGHLEPKGKTNPDGSEVWGYPAGSDLEEILEVHVRDGRVVREVLRPSARRSGKQMAGVLR